MALWAIKYSDIDERWWVDLVVQEPAPEVEHITVGTRVACDGFKTASARVLARKASIHATDLPDWPTDVPVALRPAAR